MAQTGDYTTVDFTTDPTWTSSTITARTGVLYKYVAPGGTTANQYLVAILDFGGDITSTSGDFKVTFPSATAGSTFRIWRFIKYNWKSVGIVNGISN